MRQLAAVLVMVLTVWAAFHLAAAEMSKGEPPIACQIVGGTWNLWSGWQCQ